ncbi:hypothetical protein GSI_07440 [Ganoderma sinense ZZ0214-1]|uniref:C2H2-type domain-containing protein n=1 Tax=Ganoderma sinense ZZ0214-1 TaxID=1077348 RepID=A0A2G8S929_9APHY|nr:hypothetical protein GSI_07440 [Ganoderma sinense ZZ0214-1]
MACRPRRKQHNPHQLQCPHCKDKEKWCKNLSGLTQHINAVHLDLFHSKTVDPPPSPPSPSSPPSPINSPPPLLNDMENNSGDHPEPQDSERQEEEEEEEDIDLDSPGPPPRTNAISGDWAPFSNRIEFELAEFLFKREQMPQSNISFLMDLWAADVMQHGGRPPFADHADMYRTIDEIALGDAPWLCLRIRYTGPRPATNIPQWMTEVYEIWYCDPRKIARSMLANPEFKGHFDITPYREFTRSGERRYGNVMSGNWAWRIADAIAREVAGSEGGMVVPFVFGSDKTTVSVATGQNDFYPLYMSLATFDNSVHRAHRDSVIPIAFLAIPKAERKHADTTAFRRFKRQLFHSSLGAILQLLLPGMHVPEVVRCPDGHYRCVVWALGPYIADYPEQVLVANIVQGWCPACYKVPANLDASEPGQKRSRRYSEQLCTMFEPKVLWDDWGIVSDVIPFTTGFPRADIHELLSGDLLHQLIKGTFKDHLVSWVGEYLTMTHGEARGKELLDEIDRWLAATPPFPGLWHFKQGRDFKQWTGDDSKGLMKIYLPALSGIVPSDVVRAIAAYLEFCYLAQRPYLTDSTLVKMEEARKRFHTYREIFRTSGIRLDGFSLPRQHSLDHYIQHIQNFGAPNGLCSSITESKHIKAVKEPWRRSNRYEALGQMLLTNQRLEKILHARADFSARGMLSGTCLSEAIAALALAQHPDHNNPPEPPALINSDEDLFEDDPYVDPLDDDDEDGDGVAPSLPSNDPREAGSPEDNHGDADQVNQDLEDGAVGGPRVSGFVVLARKPQPRYPKTVDVLGLHIGTPSLPMLMSRFLFQQLYPDTDIPDDLNALPICPSRVHVYHSAAATFYAPSDPSGVGGMHREHIRATPSWRKGPARYDCVLVGADPTQRGFRSLMVARIRLFFSFHYIDSQLVMDEARDFSCALVEWFSAVGEEPDEDTGLWVIEPDLDVNGQRVLDIIHINTIFRSAHLIPIHGTHHIPPYMRASDALDSFNAYFVNKYADHHAHEEVY